MHEPERKAKKPGRTLPPSTGEGDAHIGSTASKARVREHLLKMLSKLESGLREN
jgi:hypothetical protein